MQFRATGKSRAGIAAVVCAVFLAGCGGSGSGSSSSQSSAPSSEESVSSGQTVSLSWLAPGQRINGEQLSYINDIDGYIVLYGQDPANLEQQVVVECNSLNCGYDIQDLAPGTWYFAVQTVDSNGLISAPSQPVSRAI
ncbi:fibronectin type III domain-containing protein [Marinobacter lacisalsi]|uniref:Fibronectin type III domain-containing protein n=1 Tax=Marinobacter lacisalsi TaxID=475979 RepID=A0ABV8QL45_9GAMM